MNTQTLNSGTPVDLNSTYDDAGNLRTRMVSDSVRWVYTWDAWNRFVKVDIEEYKAGEWLSLAPRLHSSYYGLNQRAWSRSDAGAAGYTTEGPDNDLTRMELFYYDASWRLLERRTDETWNGTGFVHDSTSQWIWGQRYIDELVASITDTDLNDEFDQSFYAMTDRNFSVIGLSNGERVRYDAYGQAQGSPYGDADADGIVGIGDLNMVLADFGKAYGTAGYRVESDINASNSVNLADLNLVNARSGNSISRGDLSRSGNIVGYAGYIFEPATGMYVVRNRWLDVQTSGWISRDPAHYVDGPNLYQYCSSNPVSYSDPLGLWKWKGGKRQGTDRAVMISEANDSTGTAAVFSGFTESESEKWLRDETTGQMVTPGTPIKFDCPYSVPNVVYVAIGDVGASDKKAWRPTPGALDLICQWRAEQYEEEVASRGYKTVWQYNVTKFQLQSFVQNTDIAGLFFVGHGAVGVLWTDHKDHNGRQIGVLPSDLKDFFHHELAFLTLMVCDANQSDWSVLVSENGFYRAPQGLIRPTITPWDEIPKQPVR